MGNLRKEGDPLTIRTREWVPVLAAWTLLGQALFGPAVCANDDFEDDQVIVGLSPGASIASVNARYGTHTLDQTGTSDYVLGTNPDVDLDALLAQMLEDSELVYAERNHASEIAEGIQGTIASVDRTATSLVYHTQPAANALRATQAHALSTGSGVVVAVVDTGVNPDHPEFVGRLSPLGFDFVGDDAEPWETANGMDEDNDGSVDEGCGHGTHVSGLLVLAAPGSIIMPVRVLDDEGRGPAFRVAEGIRYAAEHGARVINLSLSIRHSSSPVGEAIHEAIEQGITVVVGVGNGGAAALDYPASETDVVAVAATDENGVKMPISNYGPGVTVSAPGSNTLSPYGGLEYAHWGGTSMAAPFASGGAALLLHRYPTLPPSDVTLKLAQTATSIAAQNPSYPGLLGSGLVNLEGLASVAAPNADSVMVHGSGETIVSWEPVEGATAYDVIRGLVSNLSPADNDVELGPVLCIANDVQAGSTAATPDTSAPAAGSVFFYLMRPVGGPVPPEYGSPSDSDGPLVPGPGDCPL